MQPVTIVGGGIAGLALAAALDPERFEVTLHEQRPELPAVGTTLAMWPEAQRALDAIGALDPLRDHPRATTLGIGSVTGARWVTAPADAALLVARGDLLGALDAAVPPQVQRVTGRVDRFPAVPEGAVVVGADGVHSVVRAAVDPPRATARLTSCLAVRGVVPDRLPADLMGEYWGRGLLFGTGPHRAGTNWYTSFRSDLGPRGVDVAEALAETRARHATSTAPAVTRVLAAAEVGTTLAQRIWTTPSLHTYVRGRTVLVGDAAHAMYPNLGRGACESLLDAVALGRLLGERPVGEALAAYDRERRRRTQGLQRGSALMMRLALAGPSQPVRDALLAGAGRAGTAVRASRRA
ncbi:FAD-dependent oxidoreductase [Antribacter gilvus]|uniref:FAD-dependent oxidoreductase n=1 Tax=Antribacter gilvus TaxID=2304675 RepID=UPI00197D19BF|nr:NAD(P)/FAD-dependent oxidoreductase [Antribacter gilvus]